MWLTFVQSGNSSRIQSIWFSGIQNKNVDDEGYLKLPVGVFLLNLASGVSFPDELVSMLTARISEIL